jgi:predicted Zn-dependent protease with MMP-like domain
MAFCYHFAKMTDAEFRKIVEEGIESLPLWVKNELTNVAFLVHNVPSKRQRKENDIRADETLFGLYEGVPLSERGNDSPLLPDRITLFKEPILEAYSGTEEIRACIHNTIWHEVAHYFGHDEQWVREEEKRRNKLI